MTHSGLQSEFTTYSTKMIAGFHLGGIAEYNLTENITGQAGIYLSRKGAKIVETDRFFGDGYQYKVLLTYVQVPVHVLYNGDKFFVGGGPYLAFATSGKFDYFDYEERFSFGSTNLDHWKAMDIGVGVQAGTNVGPVRIGAAYDFSVSNNIPKNSNYWVESGQIRNSVINLFAVYLFGK